MKRFIILSYLIAAILPISFAQSSSQQIDWGKDIDYLIGRLEAQHPNVYANVSEFEFKAKAEQLKSKILLMSDRQIVFGIHELLAMIKDMHTSVVPWQTQDSTVLSYFKMYPVFFYRFSDGLFVKAAKTEHKSILGSKVIKFGSIEAEKLQNRVIDLISGDNYNGRLAMCDLYLSLVGALEHCGVQLKNEKLNLTLENPEGDQFEYSVEPLTFQEVLQLIMASRERKKEKDFFELNELTINPPPLYLSKPGDAYWYQYIPEHKTMFVYLKEMQPKSKGDFERFYNELLTEFDKCGAEKLVLDVRNNGGGDHFEMPLLKGVIARPELDKPDKLFVIIGRITGSASQHFATQFDIYTNATFIGENSGGRPNHYGAQRPFTLPNSKLPVRTSQIYHQDATEWDMADCTRPDFYVQLSSEDFRNNEDPILEFIFNFDEVKDLQKKFDEKLSAAYKNEGYNGLEEAYYNFMRKYESTGISKGKLINDFLFWLLPNKKSIDDYKKFLELYTQECPDWTESWYALARRNEIEGKYDLAERYYKRSLEVFPGNTIAERMLRLMEFKLANSIIIE